MFLAPQPPISKEKKKKKKGRNTFQREKNITQAFCLPPALGNRISPSGL